MMPAYGQRVANRRCGPLPVRLARASAAALAALAAAELALALGNGVLHLTPASAALASWLPGAVVSYRLSRWVRSRAGRPDLLNETIPFWAISALLAMLLTLAGELGRHSAASLHFTGATSVLWADLLWVPASLGAFRLQFALFHGVLFADRPPISPTPSPARRPAGAVAHSANDAQALWPPAPIGSSLGAPAPGVG